MSFETLIVERDEAVTLIRLNRPQALNALNSRLLQELAQGLDEAEADEAVRCLVLTGSERAFAAGADIKEMSDKTYAQMLRALQPIATEFWFVPVASARGEAPETLAAACPIPSRIFGTLEAALAAAPERTLVTGSLFLVGEELARLSGKD